MIKLLFKIIVCGAIVSFVSCNESGSIERSDLESKELLGKVQQVTTVNYDVYDKFGEGNLQRTMPEYIFLVNICSFDSLGNLHTDKILKADEIRKSSKRIYNNKYQETKFISYKFNDDSKILFEHDYFYNDKGLVTKVIDITDNITKNYSYTYDKEGRITSQIKSSNDRIYWEYNNGKLFKKTEYFYSKKMETFYNDGQIYKYVESPTSYWIYTHDEQKRTMDITQYTNGRINKKIKVYCSNSESKNIIRRTIWNSDGVMENDYNYLYFINGNDTLSIFSYDNEKLESICLHTKDSLGITAVNYDVTSSLLIGYEYTYENGVLKSKLNLHDGSKLDYIDGILTVIEEKNEKVVEKKYKRNDLISIVTKDKNGKIISSIITERNGDKKVTTVVDEGKTKKGEAIYENGKLVKNTDPYSGVTTTYSYNKEGFVSEAKDNDGTIITYKYEYDDKGNWVRKITYKNNEPQSITERSIVYYE